DFNSILFRELVVALIMRRHAHDRAGAVIHQNVVRNPYRNLLTVVGIDRKVSGVNALLINIPDITGLLRLRLLGDEPIDLLAQIRVRSREFLRNRMLRRKLNRSCAKDGVDTSGEDGDLVSNNGIQTKVQQRALAPADPVALHGADFLRPAGKAIEIA